MRQNLLKGHTLPNEGRVYVMYRPVKEAPGVCSCGARSEEVLPSENARRRWHGEHKNAVRAAEGARG